MWRRCVWRWSGETPSRQTLTPALPNRRWTNAAHAGPLSPRGTSGERDGERGSIENRPSSPRPSPPLRRGEGEAPRLSGSRTQIANAFRSWNLSQRERENRTPSLDKTDALSLRTVWRQFSLSRRERAGVRVFVQREEDSNETSGKMPEAHWTRLTLDSAFRVPRSALK